MNIIRQTQAWARATALMIVGLITLFAGTAR
jgi:hypothetical protein